jgi:hypothetical protein
MIRMARLDPENLKALKDEVDLLDQLPRSLESLERMVKLIADRFSIVISASYRMSGSVVYLDLKYGSPTRYMSVSLDEDGRYHCFHQMAADRFEKLETATSSAAWFYVVGRDRPSADGRILLGV